MRALLKVVVVFVVVAILALVVVLFSDFDAPWVAEAMVGLAAARGVDLEVDHAAFNLRRGALLEGVVARSEAAGETVEASLDRLVLAHRLWPLLRGRVVADRLILERPTIEMVSSPPQIGIDDAASAVEEPLSEAAAEAASSRLQLDIAEIVVEQGRWASRVLGGDDSTVLEGLDVTLRDVSVDAGAGPLLLALSAQGWLEAASLDLDDRRLTDIATSVVVERGRYRLAEFEARLPAGDVRVDEIAVDMTQDPYRYRFQIAAEAIDLARILAYDVSLGVARLELRGNGEGPGLEGAVAEISLAVEAGSLPSTEILARIDRVAGTSLAGAAHEPIDLFVSLAAGGLEIDPFELATETARLELGGTIAAGGVVDLVAAVSLPRDLFDSSGVSEDVLGLLTDRREWVTIPLRISGSVDSPRLRPDMDAIGAATRYLAEQAREALRQKARNELDGVLARRLGR